MARTIEVTVPVTETDALVADVKSLSGVLGLKVQRGVSIQPPGDVVTVQVTNASLHACMRVLAARGVGADASTSATTSEPDGLISSKWAERIDVEDADAPWEEIQGEIAKESNMTVNGLALMAVAGVLATVGLATSALHVVVAAMAIAPGFEPFVAVSLGVVAGGRGARTGIAHVAKGYAALVAAAAVTALVLRAFGLDALRGQQSYFPAGVLAPYWSTISSTSLLVGAAAAIGGVLVVATHRSVLTAGVMIALALVPSAALVGVALALLDFTTAFGALLRWSVDGAFVIGASLAVLAWKRASVQRRATMLQPQRGA